MSHLVDRVRAWYSRVVFLFFEGAVRRRLRGRIWTANRTTYLGNVGPYVVTVEFRDARRPDGRSREELYDYLKTIRRKERRTGWKVPEPDEREISS